MGKFGGAFVFLNKISLVSLVVVDVSIISPVFLVAILCKVHNKKNCKKMCIHGQERENEHKNQIPQILALVANKGEFRAVKYDYQRLNFVKNLLQMQTTNLSVG